MTAPGRERSRGASRTRAVQPLSDETRARIIALAQQELPVRAIAAEARCSTGSVSNVCRLAGIPLDRGRTQAAAVVRRTEATARRAELADELLALARGELARLGRPHAEYWGVGGSAPTVLSVTMPEPPPRARHDLIRGAMALVDRAVRLTETEDKDFSNVDAWLRSLTGDSA